MPGLRILCPICTDDFQEVDEIYSTSCGHLYHLSCMQQWQSRATSCPQCRHHNPSSHKIYLLLNDDPVETPTTTTPNEEDLQVKLESSIDKIHELEALLEESQLNFFHLQEQYTILEELKKQHEHKIVQFNDNESNFLHLHAQYSESEDRAKLLQEEIERLATENVYKTEEIAIKVNEILELKKLLNAQREKDQQNQQFSRSETFLQDENDRLAKEIQSKSNELALKTKEIAKLKQSQKAKGDESSKLLTDIQITTLEQKLKHITSELEKEISNSTQLAIDKIKLQSYIQRLELQANGVDRNTNKRSNHPKPPPLENTSNDRHCVDSANTQGNQQPKHGVLLKRFPSREVKYPLEEMIIAIANKIDVPITKEDIVKVYLKEKFIGKVPQDTVSIYVQFKNEDCKMKFLSNRNLLRNDNKLRLVTIKEYVDELVHAVFIYANKKLRDVVFDYISCVNNQVVGKRNLWGNERFIIRSKEHVDELLQENHRATTNVPPQTEGAGDEIDECYYKI